VWTIRDIRTQRILARGNQHARATFENGIEEAGLVLEVIIDECVVDAGGRGDLSRRYTVEAALGEQCLGPRRCGFFFSTLDGAFCSVLVKYSPAWIIGSRVDGSRKPCLPGLPLSI
jgi:hypothetical protein